MANWSAPKETASENIKVTSVERVEDTNPDLYLERSAEEYKIAVNSFNQNDLQGTIEPLKRARAELVKSYKFGRKKPETLATISKYSQDLGKNYAALGNYEEAEKELNYAIKIQRNNESMLALIGYYYSRKNNKYEKKAFL